MDLLAIDTCVPAVTARGAIVEKGQKRCKAIGDYLNNHQLPHTCRSRLAGDPGDAVFQMDRGAWIASKPAPTRECQGFLPVAAFTLRWRWASNRQTPVATDTLRLLTLPAIGRCTR